MKAQFPSAPREEAVVNPLGPIPYNQMPIIGLPAARPAPEAAPDLSRLF